MDSEFSQVSWSHDGVLLVAAIHNRIAVFDTKKFSIQESSKQNNGGGGQGKKAATSRA